jgi:hypothetical protein
MAIRHGIVASSVGLLPAVSLSAATNFNESRATLNSTVSANGFSTTVKFQYSTSSVFTTFTEVNAATTPITGQSVSSYANITGLAVNTTYYFRCVATNTIGTTTSSSLSFVTWSLKTYANGTGGSYSLTIPTVTPTGGSALIPTVYNMFILGGGGGSGFRYGGGGGGGYRLLSSRAFTNTSGNTLSLSVGGGGGAGGAGGTTSISASNFTTLSAGGGAAGLLARPNPNFQAPDGGAVGSGDNPAYGGAAGNILLNKDSTDVSQWGGGGGGGTNSAGTQGPSTNVHGFLNAGGGNGGSGRTEYGYSGGAGGGGDGSNTDGSVGSPSGFGTGGTGGNGSAGLIYFQYYGP